MDVARSSSTGNRRNYASLLARHARELTGQKHLCLAGGVALNCVANGLISREKIFEELWIQPAAGDAGGALGRRRSRPGASAQGNTIRATRFQVIRCNRPCWDQLFPMAKSKLSCGPTVPVFQKMEKSSLLDYTIELLQAEKVIGWFQGRMEFGPRALGNRSILGDARSSRMQSIMNLKVKFRESFRPFAPVVLRERVRRIILSWMPSSPYMLPAVAPVKRNCANHLQQT